MADRQVRMPRLQRVFADMNPDGDGRLGALLEEFADIPVAGDRFVAYDDEGGEYPAVIESIRGRVVTFRIGRRKSAMWMCGCSGPPQAPRGSNGHDNPGCRHYDRDFFGSPYVCANLHEGRVCGQEVSADAQSCPRCGGRLR